MPYWLFALQLLDKKQEEEDEDLDFRALENGFVSSFLLIPDMVFYLLHGTVGILFQTGKLSSLLKGWVLIVREFCARSVILFSAIVEAHAISEIIFHVLDLRTMKSPSLWVLTSRSFCAFSGGSHSSISCNACGNRC